MPKLNRRLLMHIPAGAIAAFLLAYMPITGVVFAASFLVYEVIEDWRINDLSYFDVASYLYGLAGWSLFYLLVLK